MRAALIRTHASNRDHNKRSRTHLPLRAGGRHRKAFSLPEVAAAMAVLMIISSIISLAVARSLTAQGVVKDVRAVSTQLSSLLNQASTSDYASLVDASFVRPQACVDDATLSCLSLGSEQLEVTWEVTVGEDEAGNSLEASSNVTLSAKTNLPGESQAREIVRTREVAAPVTGWKAGQGLVRVQNAGDSYSGSVFLLTSEATPRVVDSRLLGDASSVLLRGQPSDCLESSPCFLALDAEGSLLTADSTLSVADVEGSNNKVVLTGNAITDSTLNIRSRSSLEVSFSANPDAGVEKGTPALGSICLWASLEGGRSTLEMPLCNSVESNKATLETFTLAGKELGIPLGSSLGLSVDNIAKTCPQVSGMKGFSAGTWIDGAVCTSWTWGTPSSLKVGDLNIPFEGSSIPMDASLVEGQVIWSGDSARPAAGYGDQPTWSKPRDMLPCSLDGSCVSVPAPEAATCVGLHCYSSANFLPEIMTALKGSAAEPAIVTVPGSNPFVLNLRDADSEPFNVTLEVAPTQGVLNGVGGPLAQGALLGDFVALGDIPLDYTALGSNPTDSFTLRLSDPRGSKLVTIKLGAGNAPLFLKASNVTLAQGADPSPLSATLTAFNGNPVVGAEVSLTGLPEGLTATSAVATTDSSGIATWELAPNAAAAGTFTLNLNGAAVSASTKVKITPVLDSLAGTYNQGKLTLLTLDKAGNAMPGQVVSSIFTLGGEEVRGVYSTWSSCTTSSSGNCELDVTFEDGAQTSGITAEFVSGDLESSTPIVVGG